MKYIIAEYELISPNIYRIIKEHYGLTARKTIDFIRHYTGTCDELVVYDEDNNEIFIINLLNKYYDKYYIECDKSLSDYIDTLIRQVEKRGYINGTQAI